MGKTRALHITLDEIVFKLEQTLCHYVMFSGITLFKQRCKRYHVFAKLITHEKVHLRICQYGALDKTALLMANNLKSVRISGLIFINQPLFIVD